MNSRGGKVRKTSRIKIPALVIGCILAGPVPATDLELEAEKIEGMLMAPCCGGSTVSEHYSPLAERMRVEIREMLQAGLSRREILDHYVKIHGVQVLAAPPARGFNLVAYLLPGIVLLALAVLLWWRIRTAVGRSDTAVDSPPAVEPGSPEARRLERELRLFQ